MLYQAIYTLLLPPGVFILLLLVLELYLIIKRAPGRSFLGLIIILLYLFSCRPVARLLCGPLEQRYPQPELSQLQGDVLILLGSGSVAYVRDFDGESQPSAGMAKGILFAARLHRGLHLPIVVSGCGAFGDSEPEGSIGVRNLRALGIPSEQLFAEDLARNTAENAKRCRELCRKQGWQRPILLSAALHSPRANLLFEKYGLKCQPYPCHYLLEGRWSFDPFWDLVPRAGHLRDSAAALKEYLGILAVKMNLQ